MTDIRVVPIQTGTVSIKTAQASGRPGRSALGRKVDIFRDDQWLPDLPILAFLIEHPEGRFVVDTGDSAINSRPGYLPWWNPFFQFEVQVKVEPEMEIGPRLRALGYDPAEDVTAVIMTHLHHDHAGGLHHFPHVPIYAIREGWDYARSLKGKGMGCLPQRWPPWFRPRLLDLYGPPVGPFPCSHSVTRDDRITLVPTPGHIPGHVSVIVRGDDLTYFIAADASYVEANIRGKVVDGITMVPDVARRTLDMVDAFASSTPTIVMPSHDRDSIGRLERRQLYSAAG